MELEFQLNGKTGNSNGFGNFFKNPASLFLSDIFPFLFSQQILPLRLHLQKSVKLFTQFHSPYFQNPLTKSFTNDQFAVLGILIYYISRSYVQCVLYSLPDMNLHRTRITKHPEHPFKFENRRTFLKICYKLWFFC